MTQTVLDKEAFCTQVVRHQDALFRAAKAILRSDEDAEDAVQEAIVAAWKRLNTLKDERAFKTWMMRIVMNTCRSMLRKRRRYVLLDSVELPMLEEDSARDALWESVCALEERLRLPIVLHYYEGFQIEEIAKILHRPAGTIATRMRRARLLLQEALAGKGERG